MRWVGRLCRGVAVVAVVSILELWWRWEWCRALGGGVQVTGGPGEAASLAPYGGAGGCKSDSFTCCNCVFGPWLLTSHTKDGNSTGKAGLTQKASEWRYIYVNLYSALRSEFSVKITSLYKQHAIPASEPDRRLAYFLVVVCEGGGLPPARGW